MELRQLRYFANAAATLNFTEAAAMSCVAQSTLSQQIKNLETELGTPLFDRIGKRIALTHAGKLFHPVALRTLREAEQGVQQLRDMHKLQSGKLRVGVAFGLSGVLTQPLVDFSRQYPGVELEVHTQSMPTLVRMLHNRAIDFALSFNLLNGDDEIAEEPLFASQLRVVVSAGHPLAHLGQVGLDRLAHYRLAMLGRGMNSRRLFDRYLAQHGGTLQPALVVNEVPTLLNLVRTGRWVGVMSNAVIVGEPGLASVELQDGCIPMQVALLTVRDAYQPQAVTQFLATLRQHVAASMWGKETACHRCGKLLV